MNDQNEELQSFDDDTIIWDDTEDKDDDLESTKYYLDAKGSIIDPFQISENRLKTLEQHGKRQASLPKSPSNLEKTIRLLDSYRIPKKRHATARPQQQNVDFKDDDESEDDDENEVLTKTEKEQLIEQIANDSEYLKKELEKLPPEQQLEMMLDIYQTEQMDDPDFLKKLQDNYCIVESVVYHMAMAIGAPEAAAKKFSEWYLQAKLSAAGLPGLSVIQGTYSFLKGWLGLLLLVLIEWVVLSIIDGYFMLIEDFLIEHNEPISHITTWIQRIIQALGVFSASTADIAKEIPILSWVTSAMINGFEFFLGNNSVLSDLVTGEYSAIVEHYGMWMMLITGGIAVFIWGYHIISAVMSEINNITEFCGKKIKGNNK